MVLLHVALLKLSQICYDNKWTSDEILICETLVNCLGSEEWEERWLCCYFLAMDSLLPIKSDEINDQVTTKSSKQLYMNSNPKVEHK